MYFAATLSVPGIQGALNGAATWNNQSGYLSFETCRGKLNVYFYSEIVKSTYAESTILDQLGIFVLHYNYTFFLVFIFQTKTSVQVSVHPMTVQQTHTASTT